MKRLYITIFSAALLLITSCSDDNDNPSNGDNEPTTYKADAQDVGNGTAQAWLKVDADGMAEEFGITLSKAALEGLPSDEMHYDYHLDLPTADGEEILGIKSIHLDWNPQGHPPSPIYTIPHFDMHFYVIPESTIENIGPATTAPVDSKYMADNYMLVDTAYIPKMGAHAVDTSSSEFHGKTFTHTYIYGYYDGEMAFLEPMVTRDYLMSEPNETADISVPDAFTFTGYLPQKISYKYNSEEESYKITLSDLKQVTAE